MWRFESTHQQAESIFLDPLIEQIEVDAHLSRHAEALLQAATAQEPLIAQSLRTPQDVRYHAEGPFLRDHLRIMLMFLFALAEEKIHLIDIEEFRRLKGYEGEIQELEDLIKENISFFQVFILCHDVAKWPSITFSAEPGSKGEALGFHTPRSHHFDEMAHERLAKLGEYLALYEQFSVREFRGSPKETQAQFYFVYGIQVHYPQHARKIHAPVFEDLLSRYCMAHRLPGRDRDLLEDLISHHMEINRDFTQVRPKRIRRYVHLASKRGYDADDFVDLAQACLLLDQVVGSKRLGPHGYWHETSALINFFQSEHDYAPHVRVEKEAMRLAQEKKRQNRIFRNVGLDGVSLMDVLRMDPGPEFGRMLRRIQSAVLGQGEMPKFGKEISVEIQNRAEAFYKKMFETGE